jgi:hypothetical protein
MDKLTTVPQQQAAFQLIPPWLNYLVAAYPANTAGKMTLAVMEDQFKDVDPAAMMQAARAHVKASKWFPTAQELAAFVESDTGEGEQWLIAWDTAEVLRYKRAAATWATCPNCEERTPDLNNCPFCVDMVEAV